MGVVLEPTPEQVPYRVEARSESFWMTAPVDRLRVEGPERWSVPETDVGAVLAALRQAEAFAVSEAGDGRPFRAEREQGRVALEGPGHLYWSPRRQGHPYEGIELEYRDLGELRRALAE